MDTARLAPVQIVIQLKKTCGLYDEGDLLWRLAAGRLGLGELNRIVGVMPFLFFILAFIARIQDNVYSPPAVMFGFGSFSSFGGSGSVALIILLKTH